MKEEVALIVLYLAVVFLSSIVSRQHSLEGPDVVVGYLIAIATLIAACKVSKVDALSHAVKLSFVYVLMGFTVQCLRNKVEEKKDK